MSDSRRRSSIGVGSGRSAGTRSREEVTPWEFQHTVAEVTPWELHPAPNTTTLTTSTGPVDQVTPWELAPGPDERPRSTSSTAYRTVGVPPLALQRSLASSNTSVVSHLSDSSAAFKSSRPGVGRKDSTTSSTAGLVERTRQLPLTGPLEEVAPWEMNPPPLEIEKDMSISLHAHLAAVTSLPPMSPTIEMWNAQKSAAHWVKEETCYPRQDGRSMSSSALPLPIGLKRARADSVTGTASEARYYLINGESTTQASSSASLPLGSSRDGQNGTIPRVDEEKTRRIRPHSRDGSVNNISRGRSLTAQTVSSTRVQTSKRPASGHGHGAGSIISTMNKAQMEQVLPWELCPVPTEMETTTGEEGEKDRKTARTSSSSSSSAAGKALAELGLKRRRSTGKSGVGTGTGTGTVGTVAGVGVGRVSSSATSEPGAKAISNVGVPISSGSVQPSIGQTLLPISFVPSSSSTSSAQSQSRGTKSFPGGKDKDKDNPTSDVVLHLTKGKFSTADRTILEELKANIRAREAQFLIKGVGHTMVGGRRCPGKKYHPFRKREVPYPRSYDKEVVDLDVWETMFWLDLCKGLSWHSFDRPPTKVLEIGCGTGTWILQAATTWKSCQFVGLDIVPLHPNLQNFASLDLHSRITWIQHNFLDGLPFQNEEFDFVHIKRIALGIPEDKWDKFLEEVQRVMKPGGALEMIEEDLFFPGKPTDDNDNEDEDVDEANADLDFVNETGVSNGTATLGGLRPMPQIDEQRAVQSFSDHGDQHTMCSGKFRPTQSMFDPLEMSENVAPRNPRDHSVLEAIWKGMLESRFVNSTPLSLLPTYLEYHFQDVRTHPPLLYSFPPLPTETETKGIATNSSPPKNNLNASASQLAPNSPESKRSSLDARDANNTNNHPEDDGSYHPSSTTKTPSSKHRSLYVALDETRSDALSPSHLLAPSPKKTTKSHFATLPDRTTLSLSIDIRTLNLHLALRAREIVACSEPMWEWVQEFQQAKEAAAVANRKKKNWKNPRIRSDSIEVALLGSPARTFGNARDADVLIKDAILEMTRDDFDQVLTNFQLDMQDKADIRGALERRFDWRTVTSEPLQDRKAFDCACQRYDEWLANETRNQQQLYRVNGHGYHPSSKPHHFPNYHSRNNDLSILPIVEASADRRMPRQLSSCQQLSRAMRVFVAWKESA